MTQTPQEKARREIEHKLEKAEWTVQDYRKIDFNVGSGIVVREYPIDSGLAYYESDTYRFEPCQV